MTKDFREKFKDTLQSPEGQKLFAEVRENHRKLDSCPRHTFDPPEEIRLGTKLTCIHCGGILGIGDIGYYIKGYVAHGGDSADIWPGYDKKKSR